MVLDVLEQQLVKPITKYVALVLPMVHRYLVRKEKILFSLKTQILVGIRLLDGRVTTLLEARSIVMFANHTHIKSASWG